MTRIKRRKRADTSYSSKHLTDELNSMVYLTDPFDYFFDPERSEKRGTDFTTTTMRLVFFVFSENAFHGIGNALIRTCDIS